MQLLPSIFRPFKPQTLTLSLLSKNPQNPISFNYHSFSLSLLKTHKHSHHFTQILSHAITSGHFTDPSVSSKLLLHSLFCSDNALVFSRSIFFQIQNPNVFAWNFMFRAYSQSSSPQEAVFLYNLMRCNGLLPDNYTFPSVFKACGRFVGVEKGQEVHCLSAKLGLEFDVFVQNALISMYFQCGVVEFAQRVFDMVPGMVRDVVTWNSMISGYEQSDCCASALKVFGEMLSDNGVRPNGVSLVSALTACGRSGLIDLGRKIHWFSVVNGLTIDVFLGSSLIDMYAKCGRLEDARMVFDKIPERNSFSWTSMIAGYVQSDLFKEAIQLFREMQVSGVKADSPTIACVISACGHSGALYQGRWVHSYCEKNQIEMNQTVNTSLIDMYSKCGDIEKALEIFHGLNQRDVFSWTAMISGLAISGQSEKALHLFSEMETSNVVRPNEVTFLGVLSACSHGGLVEEGFYFFEAMTRKYNLTPRLEHYGCMVDLLGRANLLVEAEKFIRSLPIQPDVVIWRSLLFACRSHGNIELAEFAAKRIEEFELEKCGARVLLSNVYASASRWRDVKREEVSGKNVATDHMHGSDEPLNDVSGNSDPKDKKIKQKGMRKEDINLKTLSEQLNEVRMDSDDVASSHIHIHGKHTQNELAGEEAEPSIRGYDTGLKRVKRRKFRGTRRTRAVIASREGSAQNEMSVASNSLAQGSARPTYRTEERGEVYAENNVTGAPGNGCGIPWNWSRIHDRGKTFLDKAGRSLSCGLSDSRLKRNVSDIPIMSEHSGSSDKSDAEALPLLMEASGSQGSTDHADWVHDYSGELGIFVDSLLTREIDSGDQNKLRGNSNGRHQNLTQKYMPRTFRDLVGQNLVAQALSNAVVKRKVGLLYVFYGPHGTGKTSCARIFARALNCQSLEHPKPCGFCNSCITHDMGKSRNIKEVGPVSNFDFESIMNLLNDMILSKLPSQYRVFVFDDCDTLSHDCWSAISKVIDRAPRRVVFILVSSSLDVLPHIVVSRCQKFFFPKLKDADIIYTLQWIATKEDLEIDKDALKLIASRSDGSLRDAEMTLEQLSLLGQRISVPLVQELVGLIPDEKLVDLLDLALSADTVNTVKNLREIMESGVEPLALMSQLATVITDILAGSYDLTKGRPRRKFFRRQALSKEDMEKLRQALKTLSEAEKQLRMSNDRLTWLTAALLQLAPDQQYMLPSSSAETSYNHSPLIVNNAGGRERRRKSNVECTEVPHTGRGKNSAEVRIENFQTGSSSDLYNNGHIKSSFTDRQRHAGEVTAPGQRTLIVSADMNKVSGADINRTSGRPSSGKVCKDIEEIWLVVLEKIQKNSLKEFMYQEGKLISVTFGAAPTVQLIFSSPLTKSMAEKHMAHILQAFESVLGSSVAIEIRCESRRDSRAGINAPLIPPASQDRPSQMYNRMLTTGSDDVRDRIAKGRDGIGNSEIVEIVASPREANGNGRSDNNVESDRRGLEPRKIGVQNQSQSLVRSKVSLAHVIQQAEGCTQRNGWTNRKAVSIAEKLEQENLRLEPKSRSLLCWKASGATRRKLSRLKIRTRKPQNLLKIVSCGKCLSANSPK